MIQQDIYFGHLQLTINTTLPVNWREQEELFFVPAMPPKKKVEVDVTFADELPVPEGSRIYKDTGLEVYSRNTDNASITEERIYSPMFIADQRPATYSRYDGERVDIFHIFFRSLWKNPNAYFLTWVHIEKLLLDVDALILHSCYTEYKGKAILFTAPSGTGKTTQAEIWKRVYGSRIVNGDKCILQKSDDQFYAGGFFLHGSADECENKSMPIHAIVIVRQSKHDYVEELNAVQKIGLLYSEITVNRWSKDFISRTMTLLEDLIQNTRVIMLHCTMEDRVAQVLHEYLFGGNDGTV